jgi:hypothetical protein
MASPSSSSLANNSAPVEQQFLNNTKDNEVAENGVCGSVKEEFPKQPFKNPENAYREALNLIAQEDL